ncbi:MAG: alpha/beta fold hydrolase [Pseudomonadota bacterium]
MPASSVDRRKLLALGGASLVSACAPRGALGVRPDLTPAQLQSVWALAIGEQKPLALHGTTRLETTALSRYVRHDVSIPKAREIGEVNWPGDQINSDRDFYVHALEQMDSLEQMLDQVAARLKPGQDVTVFVHGYNSNYAEAVYRHAQMAHDYEDEGVHISIVWPSAASATGYLTDRDATLIARDHLERILPRLTRRFPGRVVLVGHSMGAFLVMETLRQMSIGGTGVARDLGALVLVSPDIQIGVFQAQVARIEEMPEVTIVVVSQRDRALQLSSTLAGGQPRLGSPADIEVLSGMDLLVFDLSDLPNSGRGNHLAVTTSPAAVAFIRGLSSDDPALQDRRGAGLLVIRVPLLIPR